MPIYEFRCGSCGRKVEELRPLGTANEPMRCPDCGAAMERVFSVPGGIRTGQGRAPGKTCCGRDERCGAPPCSDGSCYRDG